MTSFLCIGSNAGQDAADYTPARSLITSPARIRPAAPGTKAVEPEELERSGKRQIPGSTAFVPGAAGLILAGEVIKDLIQ